MNTEKPKRIVCAALRMEDGMIVVGIRHFSPDMRATLKRIYGDEYKYLVEEQGFVNTWGEFLSREDAWVAAEANNQIRKMVSSPGTLFSENLY